MALRIIRDIFGAIQHEKTIAASEGKSPGKKRGKHAAEDNLCTFTWSTEEKMMLGGKATRHHMCGNQITDKLKRECSGSHLCRIWQCPSPRF